MGEAFLCGVICARDVAVFAVGIAAMNAKRIEQLHRAQQFGEAYRKVQVDIRAMVRWFAFALDAPLTFRASLPF